MTEAEPNLKPAPTPTFSLSTAFVAAAMHVAIAPRLVQLAGVQIQRMTIEAGRIGGLAESAQWIAFGAILVQSFMTGALALLPAFRVEGVSLRDALALRPAQFPWWIGAVVGLGAAALVDLLAAVSGTPLPSVAGAPGISRTLPGTLTLLAFVFVAPVAAEIALRGIVYPALERSIGIGSAVLLTGLAHAAANLPNARGEILPLAFVVLLGVTFTTLRALSRSLYPSIAAAVAAAAYVGARAWIALPPAPVSEDGGFLLRLITEWGPWLVGGTMILECMPIVSFFVSGVLTLLFAAALTGPALPWPVVVGAAWVGMLIGDNLSYAAGRYGGERFPTLRTVIGMGEEMEQRVRSNAWWFLLLYHYCAPCRSAVPAICGAIRLPVGRWLLLDSLGAAQFVLVVGGAGWLAKAAGLPVEEILRWFDQFSTLLIVLFVAYLAWAGWNVWKTIRAARESEAATPPAGA